MGVPWVLDSEEKVRAFVSDWELGMTLAEMAAMHGFKNINSVSRAAQRLGLVKRRGGRVQESPSDLGQTAGRWESNGRGVMVWVSA